ETLWPLFDLGRWDELIHIGAELVEWDRRQGGGQVAVMALTYMAYVHVCRGQLGEAEGLAQEFLPRAREIRDPQVLVPAVAGGSLIENNRGNPAAAVRLIEELEEITRNRAVFRSRHLPEVLRVSVAAGAFPLAERLLEGSEHRAARHQHSVLAGRAVLAEARGRLDQASALYARAAGDLARYRLALQRRPRPPRARRGARPAGRGKRALRSGGGGLRALRLRTRAGPRGAGGGPVPARPRWAARGRRAAGEGTTDLR